MTRISIFVLLTAAGSFLGCVEPTADPRLVGTYMGKDLESLTILRDTRVYHTRLAGGQEQRVMIGYAAAASSSPPNSLSVIAPDTSPFVGTSLQVSDDFQTITVRWQNHEQSKDTPAETEFVRKGDTKAPEDRRTP